MLRSWLPDTAGQLFSANFFKLHIHTIPRPSLLFPDFKHTARQIQQTRQDVLEVWTCCVYLPSLVYINAPTLPPNLDFFFFFSLIATTFTRLGHKGVWDVKALWRLLYVPVFHSGLVMKGLEASSIWVAWQGNTSDPRLFSLRTADKGSCTPLFKGRYGA